MFPGINPRQMKQAMKKMGLQQTELDVLQVIFKMKDVDLVIDNPSVSKINMMGQETYQVVGEVREQKADATPEISEEDIQTVVEQVGCLEKEAKKALEETKGDLALAIMNLKN
ncbi:MAG: nascent polypeptide-associated complex protein [Nanoarchaeota archaeon]|nr:nascent polypeptide-associated complex protein [Nanoarchaeota archaeon]MBU1269286.1 nascent polypeptide-associated complex protein [Nanoarchaeota archaeon]MBU1603777.1 nascent polypeptide-associated complex protein [Nanoarchaeota archaeon]MBU2443902.1 nascent polypeptide-associated complex protein [Nanoarchaeota archaeon]